MGEKMNVLSPLTPISSFSLSLFFFSSFLFLLTFTASKRYTVRSAQRLTYGDIVAMATRFGFRYLYMTVRSGRMSPREATRSSVLREAKETSRSLEGLMTVVHSGSTVGAVGEGVKVGKVREKRRLGGHREQEQKEEQNAKRRENQRRAEDTRRPPSTLVWRSTAQNTDTKCEGDSSTTQHKSSQTSYQKGEAAHAGPPACRSGG
jgi:hypothetical protein